MENLNINSITARPIGKSQKGQDSLIKHIFDIIGTTNKYYIEFGAVDGIISSNTWYFKNVENWNGLLLDVIMENPSINLYKRFLTKENICSVFDEFNVPESFDFLSVDVDGNDYWLLEEILKKYIPRVIMVETNVRFDPYESYAMKYNENWSWNGYDWYGASPYAFKKLSDRFGYTPVHIHLDDMIIVKNEYLSEEDLNTTWENVYSKSNKDLYNTHIKPGYGPILEFDSTNWIEI